MIKIDEIEIIALLCFLFGNGIILAIFKLVISWRTNHRNFDIKMNEMIRQNKQLCTSLIPYVYRDSLDKELIFFVKNDYKICAVLGPAGSGKTRFAQNLVIQNKWYSKYRYIYINNKNGVFFSSEDFINNYQITGKKRYIFIFDYYYENIKALNNLLDKATLSGRHKFIFIERDEALALTRILDRPEFTIIMGQHSMNAEMLAKVFCNQVLLLNKEKSKKTLEKKGLEFGKAIIEKIDPRFKRPIFAQLSAEIYIKEKDFSLETVNNKSQLLHYYWYYKFDQEKIESLHICNSDFQFILELDILLRILLLTASIAKKDIIVEKKDFIVFKIEGDDDKNKNFNTIIKESVSEKILNNLNTLKLDDLKALFNIGLKDFVKSGKNVKFLRIIAELDLVVEWVMYDSLKKWKSEKWLSKLTVFLHDKFNQNFINFIKRGTLDFPDIIELFADPSLGNPYQEFIDLVKSTVNEAYISENNEEYCLIIKDLIGKVPDVFKEEYQKYIYIEYLSFVKDMYKEFKKRNLTNTLMKFIP